MKRIGLAIALVTVSFAQFAHAQSPQPATLSITPGANPEILSVLDNTGAWVQMGSVAGGAFTPVGTAGGSGAPFQPNGTSVNMSPVSTAPGSLSLGALGAPAAVVVYNTGSNDIFVAFASTVSTTTGNQIKAGGAQGFSIGSATQIAAITSTGTSSMIVTGGSGLPTGWGGASASGGTWPGTAVPTNYGTAPSNTLTVPAVNAFITNSLALNWPGTATPTNYGTAPSNTLTVPGVNASVTGFPGNASPTAYGSAPAGNVPGVNAFVTNSPTLNWPGTAGVTTYGGSPSGTVPAVNAFVTNPATLTWPGTAGVTTIGGTPSGTVPAVNAWIVGGAGAGGGPITAPLGSSTAPSAAVSVVNVGTPITGQTLGAGGVGAIGWLSQLNQTAGNPLAAGTNTIGGVTQSGAPWVVTAPYSDPCFANPLSQAAFSIGVASGYQNITGASGKRIYVCYFAGLTNTADAITVTEGTGTNCGTSTAYIVGSAAYGGWPFGPNGGGFPSNGGKQMFSTQTAGNNMCFQASTAGPFNGVIEYVVQ